MHIDFSRNAWNKEDLIDAYSYRFEERNVFTQKDDCVENREDKSRKDGFEYLTMLTKAQYGPNTRISTRCLFEHFGAPFLMIADKLCIDEEGYVRFGTYMEFVLYEEGLNIWRMWYKDGKVTWKLLLGAKFAVSEGEIHTIKAEIGSEFLIVEVDGKQFKLYIPDIYPSFHIGIGACEGINRFYDLDIEGKEVKTI